MTDGVFGTGDPLQRHLDAFVDEVDAGRPPRDLVSQWVEAKEEPGRGTASARAGKNEKAAERLSVAAACFANTPQGGVILVGIADDGEALGTELDAVWLRRRIGDLTGEGIFPYIVARHVRGVRCLALYVHPSPVPVAVRGRVHMRVGDRCVPVPPGQWAQVRVELGLLDWSAQTSSVLATEPVPGTGLDTARCVDRVDRVTVRSGGFTWNHLQVKRAGTRSALGTGLETGRCAERVDRVMVRSRGFTWNLSVADGAADHHSSRRRPAKNTPRSS